MLSLRFRVYYNIILYVAVGAALRTGRDSRVCVRATFVFWKVDFATMLPSYVNSYWTNSTVIEPHNGNLLPGGAFINWSLKS